MPACGRGAVAGEPAPGDAGTPPPEGHAAGDAETGAGMGADNAAAGGIDADDAGSRRGAPQAVQNLAFSTKAVPHWSQNCMTADPGTTGTAIASAGRPPYSIEQTDAGRGLNRRSGFR
jgi:hypothetical protein